MRGCRRVSPAPVLGGALEVARGEASVLGDAREHPRTDLVGIVKREDVFCPSGTTERAMRAALPFDAPSDSQERGQDAPCSRARPIAHAARKVILKG